MITMLFSEHGEDQLLYSFPGVRFLHGAGDLDSSYVCGGARGLVRDLIQKIVFSLPSRAPGRDKFSFYFLNQASSP